MIAKFNPTGTHIQKDFLKVRIDFIPNLRIRPMPYTIFKFPIFLLRATRAR